MRALSSLLFVALHLCVYPDNSQSITYITDPTEQRVICTEGSICNIVCNTTSVCQGYEFRFEENTNVTLYCTARGSCREAVILSDAIHLEMYFTNPTQYAYSFLHGYAFINVYPNGYYKSVFENSQNAYLFYESVLYKNKYNMNNINDKTTIKTLKLHNINASYGIVHHHCIGALAHACYGQKVYALTIYQLNLYCDDAVETCGTMNVYAPYNNITYNAVNIYGLIERRQTFWTVLGWRQLNIVDDTSTDAVIRCEYDYSQKCTISNCVMDDVCGGNSTYQYPSHNVSTLYTYYDYHALIYSKQHYDINIDIIDQAGNDGVLYMIIPNIVVDNSEDMFWPMAINRKFNLFHKDVTVQHTGPMSVNTIILNATASNKLSILETVDKNDQWLELIVYGPMDYFYFRGKSRYSIYGLPHTKPNVYHLENTKNITFDCYEMINCFATNDQIYTGYQTNIDLNCAPYNNNCFKPILFSDYQNVSYVAEDPLWNVQCTAASCNEFRMQFACGHCYINGTTNGCDPYIQCTSDPTMHPTTAPTKHPTDAPTYVPTNHPTGDPTSGPSTYPTAYPTIHPTLIPTINPTFHPTIDPSKNPTRYPTIVPTKIPTSNPTKNTGYPSYDPTNYPTSVPVAMTSRSPTKTKEYVTATTTQESVYSTESTTKIISTQQTIIESDAPTVNPTIISTDMMYTIQPPTRRIIVPK
eukprot:206520_1